jgi:hypothetical protein
MYMLFIVKELRPVFAITTEAVWLVPAAQLLLQL